MIEIETADDGCIDLACAALPEYQAREVRAEYLASRREGMTPRAALLDTLLGCDVRVDWDDDVVSPVRIFP